MRSGFLGGFLTGLVLCGGVLGAVSVWTYPGSVPPDAGEVDVPAGSEFRQSREDAQASLPSADETPDASATLQVAAPEPDSLASLEDADTAPAVQPQAGTAEGALGLPQAIEGGFGVELDSNDPVLPSPQALAPQAPDSEQNLSISTEPAQPLQPAIDESSSAFETEPLSEEGGASTEPDKELDQRFEAAVAPLERFAAPFENTDDKPLMSIILIDDGSASVSHDDLGEFPYPISYAINASSPEASEIARKYRDAGLEVLIMADLAENASATDAEVSMQAFLSAVPEAVAVMEGTGSGLQSSREAVQQLTLILKDSGHGLVLFSDGLDTAQKLISREGVPALSIFRDFDGKGQTASVIRRFLDQAAFRAGQEEDGVIMVGRLREETISALLLWGLQDRASTVAIAPVSAVLRSKIR